MKTFLIIIALIVLLFVVAFLLLIALLMLGGKLRGKYNNMDEKYFGGKCPRGEQAEKN